MKGGSALELLIAEAALRLFSPEQIVPPRVSVFGGSADFLPDFLTLCSRATCFSLAFDANGITQIHRRV